MVMGQQKMKKVTAEKLRSRQNQKINQGRRRITRDVPVGCRRKRGADPAGGAKEAMDKVDDSANKAGLSLDKTEASAQESATSLDTMQTQVEETGTSIKTILEGAATDAGTAITQAAGNLAKALSGAAAAIKNAASAAGSSSSDGGSDPLKAGGSYDGHTGGRGAKRTFPLADAIAKERSMMPSGADLMIANTSETVIPAFAGHVGQPFKGLKFEEMESAAGFNRMASYTDQIKEIADKTAQKFTGGGMLGGGSATLNAMEALGHAGGLQTTSGFRPGDPGFHGANRARDLSNGGGETPEMNKVAAHMASQYGQSLTELIYTPLGYSIKNGQKTGLISPDNHYHHIHVAVAEGFDRKPQCSALNRQR